MKQSMAILMFRLTGLAVMAALAFLSGGTAMADEDIKPLVSVGVFARHSGGKIVYHYRVVNNSQHNIVAVAIGRDDKNDMNPNNDINQLLELPSGWNSKLGVPSTSANSPTGWRVSVIAPEQNEAHAILWEPLNERSPKLLAGQWVNKMSVSLDKPDINYLSGHAMVTFSDGNPVNLTVPLDRLDITPPDLTVILSPDTIASQSNKLVAIKASFIVKDDFDRLPEIKLESITSGEFLGPNDISDASFGLDDRYFKVFADDKNPAGRIYTVIYSATDASGNQTIASATVTVAAPAAVPAPETAPASTQDGSLK